MAFKDMFGAASAPEPTSAKMNALGEKMNHPSSHVIIDRTQPTRADTGLTFRIEPIDNGYIILCGDASRHFAAGLPEIQSHIGSLVAAKMLER